MTAKRNQPRTATPARVRGGTAVSALEIALFILAIGAPSLFAQERVTVSLRDNTTVEGILQGFGSRVFRVEVDQPTRPLREIREEEILRIEFHPGLAPAPGGAAANWLVNGDFEDGGMLARTPGWLSEYPVVTPKAPSYALDAAIVASGKKSARLETEVAYGSASWSQAVESFPPVEAVHLEGRLKSEGLEGCASLELLCVDASGTAVLAARDSADSAPVTGTRDWTRVALDANLPAGTARLWVRATVRGVGRAWFDGLVLGAVPRLSTPAAPAPALGEELARSGNFEEGEGAFAPGWCSEWPAGLPVHAGGPATWPRFRVDDVGAHGGRKAARVDGRAAGGFNGWTQRLPALPAGARRIRASTWVKTANLKGHARLLVVCEGPRAAEPGGEVASFSTSPAKDAPASADWKKLELEFPLPEGTASLTVRMGAAGEGTAWFDDVSVTAAGE